MIKTLKEKRAVLLFTDGATEAHNASDELYGEERLMKVLEKNREASGEQVLDKILEDINLFAEDVPQFDDITMVVLTIK